MEDTTKMKTVWKKYKIEILFFAWSTLLQAIFFILTARYSASGFLWASDSESYLQLGKNLLSYKMFVLNPNWGPTAFRTPLYPLFIAGLLWIVPKVSFVIVVQNICASLNVILVYRFGKKVFTPQIGLLAAFLFSIESARLFLANQLLSETLFLTFFIPATLYFLLFLETRASWKQLIFGASCLGIATLLRPITQFYPFLVALIFLSVGLWRKKFKRFCIGVCVVLGVYFLVISPWLFRNKLVFGEFKLSPLGGIQLYLVNAPHFLEYEAKRHGVVREYYKDLLAEAEKDLGITINYDNWTFESIRLMEFKYEKYLTGRFFEIIKTDPLFYVWVHAERSVIFFIDSGASQYYSAMLSQASVIPQVLFYPILFYGGRLVWAGIMLVAILGLVVRRHIFRKKSAFYLFFIVTILYFPAISAMNWMAPRFRLSINHLILLLFAESCFSLRKLVLERSAKTIKHLP